MRKFFVIVILVLMATDGVVPRALTALFVLFVFLLAQAEARALAHSLSGSLTHARARSL